MNAKYLRGFERSRDNYNKQDLKQKLENLNSILIGIDSKLETGKTNCNYDDNTESQIVYPGPRDGYPGQYLIYPGPQGDSPEPQGIYPEPLSDNHGQESIYPGPQGDYNGRQCIYTGPRGDYCFNYDHEGESSEMINADHAVHKGDELYYCSCHMMDVQSVPTTTTQDSREQSEKIIEGHIKKICSNPPPLKPKIFFSWNNNSDEFNSMWVHKKINRLIFESENILDVEKLKQCLENDVAAPQIAPEAQDSPLQELQLIEELKDEDLQASEPSNISLLFEEKLKKVQERCLNDLKSIEPTVSGLTHIDIDKEVSGLVDFGDEPLSFDMEDKYEVLNEDMIIDCFQEPDLSDYEDLSFPEVIDKLKELEEKAKIVNCLKT